MSTDPYSTKHSSYYPPWTAVTGAEMCFLAALTARASKIRGSVVSDRAMTRCGSFSRWCLNILASASSTLDVKLSSLGIVAGPTNDQHRRAIQRVFAFALLARFEELVQQQRRNLGYRRRFVNQSGMDLLSAFERCVVAEDDAKLTELIVNEAAWFLGPIEDAAALRDTVRQNLKAFKLIAEEATLCGHQIDLSG